MLPPLARMLQTGDASADPQHPAAAAHRLGLVGLMPEAVGQVEAVVRQARPEATLEVGLAYGVSALAICGVLGELDAEQPRARPRSHAAIDPRQAEDFADLGLSNLRSAGQADRVRFLRERSDAGLPRLIAEGHRVQFALVDGCHLFDAVFTDLVLVDQMLDVGGVVVVDDLWMPAVRTAISFFVSNRGYALLRPPPAAVSTGRRLRRARRRLLQRPWARPAHLPLVLEPGNLAVLRKTAEDSRDWTHFRPF